jgi:hypothetical protein
MNSDQPAWAVQLILAALALRGIRKAATLHTTIKVILPQEQAALLVILAAIAALTADQESLLCTNTFNR